MSAQPERTPGDPAAVVDSLEAEVFADDDPLEDVEVETDPDGPAVEPSA